MIIKLEDIEFNNKGASLMLYSIVSKLREIFGRKLRVVVENEVGSRIQKAELNLFQEAHFQRFKIAHLIPTSQLLQYHLVNPKDINFILNASGFSIGDQWYPSSENKYSRRIKKYEFYKKFGTKIIYLPQAFGPFKNDKVKKHMTQVAFYSDMIFAREIKSYEYLSQIIQQKEKLFLAPDFTNVYDVPLRPDIGSKFIAIIPNHKMFHHTPFVEQDYIKFLVDTAFFIDKNGFDVVLLNHEGPLDLSIIEKVSQQLPFKVLILNELPPDQVKGVIKSAFAVITSRFHGAVSALSQGVPVLVTSWSHKYKELLKEYNLENSLIEPLFTFEVKNKLELILDENRNKMIRESLIISAEKQKERTHQMWDLIFANV